MARSNSTNLTVPGASASRLEASDRRSAALNLLISLRPHQWTKNLLVFAGLIWGEKLFEPGAVAMTVASFAIFCALSGVVYLINDIADRHTDREHPLKRRRPIASGALPVQVAITAASVIGTGALAAAFALRWQFGVVSLAYLVLQALYSASLKHIVII